VFHHRRNQLRTYWKQQVGYGKAEALLERKWPDKYNAAGHLTWVGRVYNARGLTPLWWRQGRIYQGTWGTAPYQKLYQPAAGLLGQLPLVPEWYLVILFLITLSLTGLIWKPLLWSIPLLGFAIGSSLLHAFLSAALVSSSMSPKERRARLKALGIGFILHLMQPLARLSGRFRHGLHPWRHHGVSHLIFPKPHTLSIWSEQWRPIEDWLTRVQTALRAEGGTVLRGGGYDRWDLEVQGGILGGARTKTVVEEHGAGRQMVRFRIWPRCSASGLLTDGVIVFLAVAAGFDHAWLASGILGATSLLIGGRAFYECALAMHNLKRTFGILTALPAWIEAQVSKAAAVPKSTSVAAAAQGS
jgi:hypothetical protein